MLTVLDLALMAIMVSPPKLLSMYEALSEGIESQVFTTFGATTPIDSIWALTGSFSYRNAASQMRGHGSTKHCVQRCRIREKMEDIQVALGVGDKRPSCVIDQSR